MTSLVLSGMYQSSMVFAEHAGLLNLYAIARFCQSRRVCRRAAFFQHFGEPLQDCNGMCDNCAYSREIMDLDVTAHAKSLIVHLKELSSTEQKTTMLQLVESWRSRSRQTGEDAALIRELSKEDVERLVIQLLLDHLLKEEFQHTAYTTNAYLTVGTSHRAFIQGQNQRKIHLEIIQGAKAKPKKQSGSPVRAHITLQLGMAQVLDSLRQELAGSHGNIFPHSVLSSQHITMLCARTPRTLDQVEEVIGKRKTQYYGPAILEAIENHLKQNSGHVGLWMSPNGVRTPSNETQTPKSSASKAVRKQTAAIMITPKTGQAQHRSTSVKGSEMSQETYINLDSESEEEDLEGERTGEEEILKQGKGTRIKEAAPKEKQWESEGDDDEDFIKRNVKRKRGDVRV